jgi:hypothetical protein
VAFGHWLRQHGKLEKGEPHFRNAVRIYRAQASPPQEYYMVALDGLFQIVRQREDATEETISLFHECMKSLSHAYGQDQSMLAPQYFGFAQLLVGRERSPEAIELIIEGIRLARQAKGSAFNAASTLKMLEGLVRCRAGTARQQLRAGRGRRGGPVGRRPQSRRLAGAARHGPISAGPLRTS